MMEMTSWIEVAMKEQLGDGVKAEIILGELSGETDGYIWILAVLSPGVPTDLPVVKCNA